MSRPQTWAQWLRLVIKEKKERGGELSINQRALELPSLAIITGQDSRALTAIAAVWDLYFASDVAGQRAARTAAAALLRAMQASCWPFARVLIARSGDWSDCGRVFPGVQRLCHELPVSIGGGL